MGETVNVPANAPQSFRDLAETPSRLLCLCAPAGQDEFFTLYLHGGGMILGNGSLFDGPIPRYVASTRVSTLSLEHPLEPEHPHPSMPTNSASTRIALR